MISETLEDWLEMVGRLAPERIEPRLVEPPESLDSTLQRHLAAGDFAPMITPPNPPRMLRIAEGSAADVAEQLGYAMAALAAQGLRGDAVAVTFVDGTAWVHSQ